MDNTVSWLVTCPASDMNFKLRLKTATKEQIEEALNILSDRKCSKNKITALERALKKARNNQ